ncbi:MAG: radical SAM protein [candidate division NC10 bacterium]|nr:radical SAM protein [candidate division NC10 bacterium]
MVQEPGGRKPRGLWEGIVYGPIPSRRLGLSLGVNVLPIASKLCSFNCRYCQLGWTPRPPDPERHEDLPTPELIVKALEEALSALAEGGTSLDTITFSGNGEPTLHPSLDEIAQGSKALRDRYAPQAKLAILSNSSTVGKEEVRQTLHRFDLKIMKLDAGDEETIRRLNRPLMSFSLQEVIEGVKALEEVILQSLFVRGRVSNIQPEILALWIERVREIRPLLVQVYSLDRVPADRGLEKVERNVLEEIARLVEERTGVKAEVY